MARKFLTDINMSGNEVRNASIQPLGSAPSSPVTGQVYFDTTLKQFGVYTGTSWLYMNDIDVSQFVDKTSAQTISGVKTFSAFPITPSSDPSTNYQVANKKYVDDSVSGLDLSNFVDKSTAQTVGGVKTFTSFPVTPSTSPTTNYQTANKKYVDDAVNGLTGYTDSDARGAVGSILADTATAQLKYDSGVPNIKANVLDSPLLGGQDSAYHLNRANHTGSQSADTITDGTNNKVLTAANATKLGHLSVTAQTDLDDIRTRVEGLDAAVVLKGSWDASTGSFPGGGTALSGDSYIVSKAGVVDGQDFNKGDRVLALKNNASTSTYADNWLKLDYTDQVLSVNGETGAVVLTTDDIADSLNKRYVTDADLTKLGNTSGTNTGDEPDASTSVKGVVQYATKAQANAKSSGSLALTPASVQDFARKYTGTIGNGSSVSIDVTHGLGSQYVTAQAFEVSTNELVECDIVLTSSTKTTFKFSVAPASNAIRVVITG